MTLPALYSSRKPSAKGELYKPEEPQGCSHLTLPSLKDNMEECFFSQSMRESKCSLWSPDSSVHSLIHLRNDTLVSKGDIILLFF